MNKPSNLRPKGSLLERASDIFDFRSEFLRPTQPEPKVEPVSPPDELVLETPAPEAPTADFAAKPVELGQRVRVTAGTVACIDRVALEEAGLINPDNPIGVAAEEFRIIKRQLLVAASAKGEDDAKHRVILVCSAEPGEGKTFCAANLALSMIGEEDLEILLVEGDFAKPDLLALLGIEPGPGLIDAIIEPDRDPNDFILKTDIRGLSVLPAGKRVTNVTELVASARTADVLRALTDGHPNRILIFDSPPALVASPASVLASHAGQVMMVVRADRTTESDVREALSLLSACEDISLMLNGTSLTVSGRRFGSYYGYTHD